jgi:DNA replication initiation complex subunit (GINS family)
LISDPSEFPKKNKMKGPKKTTAPYTKLLCQGKDRKNLSCNVVHLKRKRPTKPTRVAPVIKAKRKAIARKKPAPKPKRKPKPPAKPKRKQKTPAKKKTPANPKRKRSTKYSRATTDKDLTPAARKEFDAILKNLRAGKVRKEDFGLL